MTDTCCVDSAGDRHPNILHVLDVSTAHLTLAESHLLDAGEDVGAFGYQGRFEHGYYTYLRDIELMQQFPEDRAMLESMGQGLKDVLAFAQARGIGYVRFDGAADLLDGAHSNDW